MSEQFIMKISDNERKALLEEQKRLRLLMEFMLVQTEGEYIHKSELAISEVAYDRLAVISQALAV